MNTLRKYLSANIREISLTAVILLICVFMQVRSQGVFLTTENIADLFTETAILAILAVGMMMVIITAGIDLSIGSIMGLSGMVAATLLKHCPAMPTAVILLVGAVTGLLCGAVNGLLIAKWRILPIIATLGTMYIFRGCTYLIANGHWILQGDMTPQFLSLATGSILGINHLVLFAAAIYFVGYVFLNQTCAGRRLYAIGNSVNSARITGIRIDRVLIGTYAAMGTIAGFAGILYVCKFAAAQGETATGYEMNVIAACVLGGVAITGGTGRIQGVLLGTLLLGILNNAMPLIHVSTFWQEAIRGSIILLSIIVNCLIQRRIRLNALKRRQFNG